MQAVIAAILQCDHGMTSQDDGSGRQQVTFQATTGGYNMIIYNGRPCNRYISAQSCASGATGLTFAAGDDGSGLQVWTVSSASNSPYFANGFYQISNTARAACGNVLGSVACTAGNTVDMEPGGDCSTSDLQAAVDASFVHCSSLHPLLTPNFNTHKIVCLA